MTTMTRLLRAAATLLLPVLLVSGCSWTGLNSVALPFTPGRGDDRIEVTVQLRNAANLVANSEVRYHEITVGSIRKIELDENWVATLTLGLEPDARVPADVTANVAQKSLLGAEYLALADPAPVGPEQASSGGFLASGDVIGLDRTGRYPETEEVLAAGAMLFNGGGIPQIRAIAQEMNSMLGGRTGDVKSFVRTVRKFTGRLARQRDNIAATLTQLDRLSRGVVQDKKKVAHALDRLPDGIALLADERTQLVTTLRAIDSFGRVAGRVIGSTKADLQENLNNLRPVSRQLARHGDALSKSIDALGYPFNVRTTNKILAGDYINLVSEIEVSAEHLSRHWLGGTTLDGVLNGAVPNGPPVGTAGQATDPLTGLLELLANGDLGGDRR